MSLFSPNPSLGLVYHIGTSSVGAAVVQFRPRSAPLVQASLREHMPYRQTVDAERFVGDMVDTLKSLNARLARAGVTGDADVRHVFYVFSSPWAMSETKIVSLKEDKPFSLSRSQVDRIVSAHEKLFEAEMAGTAAPNSLRAIERRVIDIRLNGYHVAQPYGKKTRAADISFFTSLVPRSIFDQVADLSRQTYRPRDTHAHSFSLASFSVIRDVFHEESDFIFLDVGGELSDITIVQNGLILETASFPLGRHFLIRKVMQAFAVSQAEAVSMAMLYFEGTMEAVAAERMTPVMEQAADEWLAGFHQVLENAAGRVSLPTKLFVVVNPGFSRYFMQVLRREELFATLVDCENLKSAVEFVAGADKDPFAAVCAAFAGRVYESGER